MFIMLYFYCMNMIDVNNFKNVDNSSVVKKTIRWDVFVIFVFYIVFLSIYL